ncbi:GNAT family N-acetyltransferase [Xenorhabdus bovienii]|uniref:tRNA(Met) cytidine acetyltransferase TmcA n=1 Tax=Xenorhabdus bovienii TaxID=40576 RepID=UPI0023B2250A|nr:GNAT family N-acetyltransferase [Xenorhabdus bovienii]MDE9493280.1 GNAT family N-acetyltransferase [Xenorhabdus bovienii]MDE9501816.1 GNAT family N-acetyltransferase [Xenorhabdus bovienii]MDE9525601.1 GNAT family N-acetyltransferase [Xenorhabdus bovienii]MDE9568396.1 GNAT family N-acetyltransferase [Xenorhabdus bovienii]
MTVLDSIWKKLQEQMQRQGQRRLVVLSGNALWSEQIVNQLKKQFQGDWVTVASGDEGVIEPVKAFSLLGREFMHGIFDVTRGFNAEALAILAGTLKAGSWLVMRVPTWSQWPAQPDEDSLRWNESAGVISTPHFIQHIQQQILELPDILLWQQGKPFQPMQLLQTVPWQMPDGNPTASQQAILEQLLRASQGVWVVTAPRGRGKSALAGMLIQQWPGKCWLCAPAKITTEVIRYYSGTSDPEQDSPVDKTPFWAVDNLLKYCRLKNNRQGHDIDADWLLIDEAAAIPTPQLAELIRYFPRVLLTTTVQGYEGTGRGFLLKLCATLPDCHVRELETPMRWAENDPLETWLDSSLLFDDKRLFNEKSLSDEPLVYSEPEKNLHFYPIAQAMWLRQPELLRQFYGLLTSAHYRTSPLDLRRLLDGNGMTFLAAISRSAMDNQQLIGALWMVSEGGLPQTLAHEVWAGRRRPRGNLVAQSLAAHGGFPQAATMRSQRVSRIAVQAQYRRRGIAQHLVAQQCQEARAQKQDFLSVSFGYTAELWSLWQTCGFRLVRMGTHLEASSGCYTAMAILPLSEKGKWLAESAQQQLCRDAYWLELLIGFSLPIDHHDDNQLSDSDWQELAGFAFAHRPLSASYFALQRLLLAHDLALPALRKYLQQQIDIEQCARDLSLSGRKALLKRCREETAGALASIDEILANQWKNWTISCGVSGENRPHHPIYH